jgi:AGCS family alanine or glycine:cation symporter
VQAFSVYIDTLFVCSATAFMILITGAYNVHGGDGGFLVQNIGAGVQANSPAFTQIALESVLPGVGKPFVAVALFFFAFTTLLAYYYIAETNVAYLRRTFKIPGEMVVLKIALMASVFYGAVRTADLAWGLGDIGVGIMAWLNIIAILILFFMGKPALTALADYEAQRKAGVQKYSFDPEALGIRNADFWSSRS